MTGAQVSADGQTVFLAIADLQPTWSMELKYTLKDERGQRVDGLIHNTIHALGD